MKDIETKALQKQEQKKEEKDKRASLKTAEDFANLMQ